MNEEELFTVKEILKYLKISRASLYKLIKNENLPHIKLGGKVLFRKKDIDEFLESKLVK